MSLSEKDLKSLLLLNRMSGGGLPFYMAEFLQNGMPPSELVCKILGENFLEKKEDLEKSLKNFSPDSEFEKAEEWGIRILSFWDEDYPAPLKTISHAPVLLYVAGTFIPEDSAALAIVGSRYPSIYGISQTRRFASALASYGLTIISGMAQGIDLAAHEGALSISHGRTLAVLGCGLDVDYPRHRKKIQDKILERGALISEYSFGTPPLAENFPKRNRIIAGLSLGVFVAEAHERSGSLITARQGLDQGKEVFALPGPVDRITSRGAHLLIQEGACLVECPEDILENLKVPLESLRPLTETKIPDLSLDEEIKDLIPLPAVDKAVTELSILEAQIIGLLKERGGLVADEIAAEIEKPLESLMPAITILELKRVILKSRDSKYTINFNKDTCERGRNKA